MRTATIFGSVPNPAAQPAATPVASPAVAPVFESYSRDGAPLADASSAVAAGIFESCSNQSGVVPTAATGPVNTTVGTWLGRIQRSFDRWTASNAQARADARVWDVARSDPSIMADLMHARPCDDSELLGETTEAAVRAPAAPMLEAIPAACQPHQRTAGQGWGRIIEDAYQHRFHQARYQRA
jgi:hypothetical protein